MLRSLSRNSRDNPLALPFEEHPEVKWGDFGVELDMKDMPRLHEILAALART